MCVSSNNAGVAKLADAPDLGSGVARRAGSSPVPGISLRDPMESILLASLLFGSIGCGAFVYGKRQTSAVHMILGALLIGYPYDVSNTFALYGIGIALTLALFVFKG
jgi:hypothetical protein